MQLKCYLVKKKQGGIFTFLGYKDYSTATLSELFDKEIDLSKYRLDEYQDETFLVDINDLKEFGSDKTIYFNRYKYILHSGSSRSSKTVSLCQIFDTYARSKPNKRLTAWRDTKKGCKDTVLNDMLKILKTQGLYKVDQKFNKTESVFEYLNGSAVEIQGTDDEEKVHGLTQDCAWLNEPYSISETTFNQIDQRTADFVFIDLNPKKSHWSDKVSKKSRTIVIHSTYRDNPFCPTESRTKIESYQPVSMTDAVESELIHESEVVKYDFESNPLNLTKRQCNELKRCLINEADGSANAFNWSVYGLGLKAEKPNRIFNWKEISDTEYHALDLPKYIGNDWGKIDPWAIVEAKFKDNNLYVHEINYRSESKIKETLTATEILQIVPDQSNEANQETGLVLWYYKKLGIPKDVPIICDTNRPLKIAGLRREGYRAEGAHKNGIGGILEGVNVLESINIYYTKSSVNIAYEQENYSREVDRYGEVLEKPLDKDNHTIDAIRYIATYLRIKGIIKVV